MEERTIGWLIRETRLERKIKATVLARGLCTSAALSRYENSIRVPDKFMGDALLERLGLQAFPYEFIASDQEFEQSLERRKIDHMIQMNNTNLAENVIEEFERKNEKSILHKQFVLQKKAQIANIQKDKLKQEYYLKQALKCTECDFMEEKKSQQQVLLTNIEWDLCYCWAELEYQRKSWHEVEGYFQKMKAFLEQSEWNEKRKQMYYPKVLGYLAEFEMRKKNFDVAKNYIDTAEQLLIKNFRISGLERILELQDEMGNRDEEKLLAIKMIVLSQYGKLTEEQVKEWVNTKNRILLNTQEKHVD